MVSNEHPSQAYCQVGPRRNHQKILSVCGVLVSHHSTVGLLCRELQASSSDDEREANKRVWISFDDEAKKKATNRVKVA